MLTILATGGGYKTENTLCISHTRSLSHSVHCCALAIIATTIMIIQLYNKFALSHIYTNMTFRLFTNIAPMGSQETYLQICLFIRWALLTRPAPSGSCRIHIFLPVLTGPSSSGSCRPTSSDSCQVLFIRFSHRSCRPHSSSSHWILPAGFGHPIRRDRYPNNSSVKILNIENHYSHLYILIGHI